MKFMNLHEIVYAPTKGMIYNATPMVARMRTVGLWIAIVWFIFDIVNLGLPAFLCLWAYEYSYGNSTNWYIWWSNNGRSTTYFHSFRFLPKPPCVGDFPAMDYQRASPRSEPRSQPLGPQVQQRRGHGPGLRHGREEMLPARCRGCSSQISKTASSKQLKNWECHLQTQLKHGGITANWIYKQLALGTLSFSLWPFWADCFDPYLFIVR